MLRIDVATATGSLPTPATAGTPGYFTEGNPGTGTPATVVTADWLNAVQEELIAVIADGSLSPSKTTLTQVRDAIRAMIAASSVVGTAITTTSGSSWSFTSIPSWANQIDITFAGVSTNGTSPLMLQIGSGSTLTSGYLGTASVLRNGFNPAVGNTPTAGFVLTYGNNTATCTASGSITLRRVSGNIWACSGSLGDGTTAQHFTIEGHNASLSGALDRVVVTTQGGTDTGDAGSFSITYRR